MKSPETDQPSGVRFAPSPTGVFHVGNLRTAWISWKISRILREPWVVRFEDIDAARSSTRFQQNQLEDLERLGMIPDKVVVQSQHRELHEQYFETARAKGLVYPCICSRVEVQRMIAELASAPHQREPLYTGHCRFQSLTPEQLSSVESVGWRFRSPSDTTGCHDFLVGRASKKSGRWDPSYHWACALDDGEGAYRLLVRAWDLESVWSIHQEIIRWAFGHCHAKVFHTALVVGPDQERLEKRSRGVTLDEMLDSGVTITRVLEWFASSWDEARFVEGAAGEAIKTICWPPPLHR